MIIGITGTYGAGKGAIVDFLVRKRSFRHFSVSGYIAEKLKEEDLPATRENLIMMGNSLRQKFGAGYLAEELYKKASKLGKNSVIESIRTLGELRTLKGKQNFYLFAVDADIKTRYKRRLSVGEVKDKITFEEFKKNEDKEMESKDPSKQNLRAVFKKADYKFLNNGSLKELYNQVEEVLDEIEKKN